MNRKDPSQVLDDISREHIPQDLNLMPDILAKIQPGKPASMKTKFRLRVAALLLALVTLVTLFSQPGVVRALKQLMGYIPGMGPVNQSDVIRILAAPVTETRGEYILTVESAILDSTHSVVNYQISGPFPTWEDPALKPTVCQGYPTLRLADGQELAYSSAEGGQGGGMVQWQIVFPAIPAAENRVTLVLPCLAELPVGEGPQDWQIALDFVPAPPEMTVYPVVDLPTPIPALPVDSPWQIQFALQSVAQIDAGYYLQARLGWKNAPVFYEMQFYPDALHLVDGAGQAVPFWLVDQNPPFAPAENETMSIDLQTGLISDPGQARLSLDYVGLSQLTSTRFSLDVGSNPQPGQTWPLDKTLDVNGHSLRVLSAEYMQTLPGESPLLILYLEAGSDIITVTALDVEHAAFNPGGSPSSDQVFFRTGWHYPGEFPQGTINVEITSLTIRQTGPWVIEWAPSAPSAGTPTGQTLPPPAGPALCQADVMIQAALSEIPAGLGGKIAAAQYINETHKVTVANLDGSGQVSLGVGLMPALSPDGTRVVYFDPGRGLLIYDLAGDDILVLNPAGKDIFDLWPKWSPDGHQIAFEHVSGHASEIYVVNSDGTNLHPLINSETDERLLGWSPDSGSISYMVPESDRQSIRVLNLTTNTSYEVGKQPFEILNASLSPDGSRMVYSNDLGTYIVSLGNSEPELLLANTPEFGSQIHPAWSADGQWLIISISSETPDSPTRLALLQPDTCQLVYLQGHAGDWVSSWVR